MRVIKYPVGVSFKLTTTKRDRLKQIAEDTDQTVAEILRELVDIYLENPVTYPDAVASLRTQHEAQRPTRTG